MAKYLDNDGLIYLWSKIKNLFSGKVDKEAGKGLSTNDYTTAEKNKLAGISSGAEANVQSNWNESSTTSDAYIQNKPTKLSQFTNDGDGTSGSSFATKTYVDKNGGKIDVIKVNGTAQGIVNKSVDITVPTKTSNLTNDSNFQTQSQVQSLINSSLEGITGIDFQVVSNLPSTGEKGIIYLISNGGDSPNVYDEYIWVTSGSSSSFEKIGTTAVDLSGYWSKTELVSITNAEIDSVVAS